MTAWILALWIEGSRWYVVHTFKTHSACYLAGYTQMRAKLRKGTAANFKCTATHPVPDNKVTKTGKIK